ncbi:MAG: hypothetical protein ABJE66_33040 [Deltaproteobacteria bacterium]
MGKLSLSLFALGVAACGSDNKGTADAGKTFMDAPPKVFMDAPPKVYMDAPPVVYDFSCFDVAPPTTATDQITISGATETFNGSLSPVGGFTVETYKTGTATAVDTQTSAMTTGAFTTGNIATGGLPLDGYVKASLATYRTSYLYPPNAIVKSLANTPVPVISDSNPQVMQLLTALGQDDATQGLLLITVADCSLTPIAGATLTAKQGGQNAGMVIDLSQLQSALAGLYLVAKVPDGDVTLGASYGSMTFPSHVVHAYQKPAAANSEGTLTVSAVVPGPF